jgi:hypothetical protein
MQRKTQAVAEEKISEASSRVTGMATDIGSRAAGQWDKLETIFEDRVAKALCPSWACPPRAIWTC